MNGWATAIFVHFFLLAGTQYPNPKDTLTKSYATICTLKLTSRPSNSDLGGVLSSVTAIAADLPGVQVRRQGYMVQMAARANASQQIAMAHIAG
jgi:hypothetical protein